MDIKLKRSSKNPILTNISVPSSHAMKEKIDDLKSQGIDVNEMTREFLQSLINAAGDAHRDGCADVPTIDELEIA